MERESGLPPRTRASSTCKSRSLRQSNILNRLDFGLMQQNPRITRISANLELHEGYVAAVLHSRFLALFAGNPLRDGRSRSYNWLG